MRVCCLSLLLVVLGGPSVYGGPAQHKGYRYEMGGVIEGLTTYDVNGDGRQDVVMIVRTESEPQPKIVMLETPAAPAKKTYFPASARTSIACAGKAARAGVVAVGAFREPGKTVFRFLGPDGVFDVGVDGKPMPMREGDALPLAFGRSGKESLHFAKYNGPKGELAAPDLTNATMRVIPGTGAAATPKKSHVAVRGTNLATRSTGFKTELDLPRPSWLRGHANDALFYEPERHTLRAASSPTPLMALPFMKPPKTLANEELHTARVQFADVNGDKVSDVLVTLLVGRRDRLGSLRTILFHYDGATVVASGKNNSLRLPGEPRCRIDTESVALHPRFVDLNGDGALDYVCDSVRGTKADLFLQVMGKDPTITITGFLFDPKKGTFSNTPYFTIKRVYPSSQALSNRFGQSAWFDGDFDGDGHKDLLDLGNLSSVVVLKGGRATSGNHGDPATFDTELVPTIPVKDGLRPHATILDLNGDGKDDAILRSDSVLYLLVSQAESK